MTEAEGIPFRVAALERRVERLEQFEPAAQAEKLDNLHDDVVSLKRAFYVFAFGVVGSAIVFAFSVLALLGGHP